MGRVRLGAFYSCLNKLFDLAPPLLIGAAVDIVVEREDSFIARFGIDDPAEQLLLLAVVTALIWIAESVFEFLQKIVWRNLAQRSSTSCDSTRTATSKAWKWPSSRTRTAAS